MAIKEKKGNKDILNWPMIRRGKDEKSAFSQKSYKFAKDIIYIVGMLNHL